MNEMLNNIPSIENAKIEKKIYARLFIPYTINGWYIMGVDKLANDYKLFVVEKWNTPLILRINAKTILLSELVNKYDSLTFDENWNVDYAFNVFSNINGLD